MENEYYYRNELEKLIDKWIEKETLTDNELGYIAKDLAKRMADAAFSVLQYGVSLNEFFKEENMIAE